LGCQPLTTINLSPDLSGESHPTPHTPRDAWPLDCFATPVVCVALITTSAPTSMAMACLHRAEALSQGSEMDMGYRGHPYGWMVYLCLLHGKSQTTMDRSSFSHMFTGLVEGKNETGKPYISWGKPWFPVKRFPSTIWTNMETMNGNRHTVFFG